MSRRICTYLRRFEANDAGLQLGDPGPQFVSLGVLAQHRVDQHRDVSLQTLQIFAVPIYGVNERRQI